MDPNSNYEPEWLWWCEECRHHHSDETGACLSCDCHGDWWADE
jgi:hypothetical protein